MAITAVLNSALTPHMLRTIGNESKDFIANTLDWHAGLKCPVDFPTAFLYLCCMLFDVQKTKQACLCCTCCMCASSGAGG